LIQQALEKGQSYGQTAYDIRNSFDGFSGLKPQEHIRDRAEGIAVTETGNAYSESTMIQANAMKQAGLDMEKSWLITGGPVCDDCQGNADDEWIPIDQLFSSGDDRPLAHPYCRCALLTRVAGANYEEK
jgi:hypothetical protein